MQTSQVSALPADKSGSGVLKGTLNLLPKPDKRLSFYVITTKRSQPLCVEQLKKYKLKYIIKKILKERF